MTSYLLPCLTILMDVLAGVVQTTSKDKDQDIAVAVAIDESVEGDCSESNADGDAICCVLLWSIGCVEVLEYRPHSSSTM
jgi:hypothetical protein